MKVLFLTPWYPSERDAMAGLFVQKHADAVRAQGVDVRVIHSQTWRETWQQWRTLRLEGWMPDVVQLNVIQKQGLLALWLKQRYNIPYIIVEHFSGYLPTRKSITAHSLHTVFMRKICANAEIVMPVSLSVQNAMKALGFQAKEWKKINNVVDDFFYKEALPNPSSKEKGDKKKLLHVSCFDETSKNIRGLLNAIRIVADQRTDFTLTLVGTGKDYQAVRVHADTLRFPMGLLKWTGELPPRQVAKQFARADIFVLNSNFENAPVVISESLVTGTPIVSTDVGGIPEMVNKQCGVLIPPHNDQALANAINTMLNHYQEYDKSLIQQYGEQYSFAAVGAQLKEIYRTCVQAKRTR